MDTMTNDTSIMALFEIFFSCQKVFQNSILSAFSVKNEVYEVKVEV